MYSKPTDAHLYFNAGSFHPKSQIFGIAKGVALRLRRICSSDEDFKQKSKEYFKYLTDCGRNKEHVLKVFHEVGGMTRHEARKSKRSKEGTTCVFVSQFNPRAPDISKIFRKQRSIHDSDKRAQ